MSQTINGFAPTTPADAYLLVTKSHAGSLDQLPNDLPRINVRTAVKYLDDPKQGVILSSNRLSHLVSEEKLKEVETLVQDFIASREDAELKDRAPGQPQVTTVYLPEELAVLREQILTAGKEEKLLGDSNLLSRMELLSMATRGICGLAKQPSDLPELLGDIAEIQIKTCAEIKARLSAELSQTDGGMTHDDICLLHMLRRSIMDLESIDAPFARALLRELKDVEAIFVRHMRKEDEKLFGSDSKHLEEKLADEKLFSPDSKHLEEKLESIENAIEQVRLSNHEFSAAIISELSTMSTKYRLAIVSRGHLAERLADLREICNSDASAEEKLNSILTLFKPLLAGSSLKTQALRDLSSTNAAVREQALNTLVRLAGAGVIGGDLKELEFYFNAEVAHILGQIVPDCGLHSEAVGLLCQLALHSGQDPAEMLRLVSSAPQWLDKDARTDFVSVMARAVLDTMPDVDNSTAAQRGEVLRYVDMLFQGAKIEASDSILELKRMLMPAGHESDADLQHSCMMATSQLLDEIEAGSKAGQYSSRTKASLSARSYVLTPGSVAEMKRRLVNVKDFNYHLAHVALLQKKAAQAGLFPLDQKQIDLMEDMSKWCAQLGLDNAAARYAGEIDNAMAGSTPEAKALLRRLQGASNHFVRGFSGESEVEKASDAVLGTAKMSGTLGHERRMKKVFHASDDYVVRAMLNETLIALTGMQENDIYRDDKASTAVGSGHELNGENIDAVIKAGMKNLIDTFTLKGDEAFRHMLSSAQNDQEQPPTPQQEQGADMAQLTTVAEQLNGQRRLVMEMGSLAGEVLDFRREQAEAMTRHDAMKAAGKSTRASSFLHWPGHTQERLAVCERLRTLEKHFSALADLQAPKTMDDLAFVKHLLSGDASTLDDEARVHRTQLLAGLEELRGIHPGTLLRSGDLADPAPTLDAVIKTMLPHAEAFSYFHRKSELGPGGTMISKADKDLARMGELRDSLSKRQKDIDSNIKTLTSILGSNDASRLDRTVQAAVLKLFCESHVPVHSFNVHTEANMNALRTQLKDWGMDMDVPFFTAFVKIALNELTLADGTLDIASLRDKLKSSKLGSWEIRRDFGISGLMAKASRPGSGFVYDCTHGLVVDTGKFFHPFQHDHSLVSVLNLSAPYSLNFEALHKNSLTVMRGQGGSYTVILKGTASAALGASYKVGGNTMGTFGGKVGTQGFDGISLTFSNGRDTEEFLKAFMDPESPLHPQPENIPLDRFEARRPVLPKTTPGAKQGKYDPAVWLKASQIKFIDGKGVSVDITATLTQSLFKERLGESIFAATGSSSGTLALHGDLRWSHEQNTQGTAVKAEGTFLAKGIVSAFSPGIAMGKNTLANSPLLMPSAPLPPANINFTYDIQYGEQGVMPSTTHELDVPLSHLSTDLALGWLLPANASEAMKTAFRDALRQSVGRVTPKKPLDPGFIDELFRKHSSIEGAAHIAQSIARTLYGLPPSMRVTIKRPIKPEVLKEVRQLAVQARLASGLEQTKLQLRMHALLASPASYRAAFLVVKRTEAEKVSHNWSPGLGFVQFKRNHSFMDISSDRVEIPLSAE